MKILHTADLHLTDEAPERWEALEELAGLARDHRVSALVVVGDLFDRHVEAEKLRGRLRSVFGGGDFRTVILPGNHDYKAYMSGLYFGENVTVLNSWEEPLRFDSFILWGLPYERLSGEHLVQRLQEMAVRMDPAENNLLLYHGELLDAYFSRQELGDEGEQRYMPAKLSYFEPLPLKYVLAGHFHSRYMTWHLPGGGLFIYPGSPVAVTARETGRRVANLVSPDQSPIEISLNSFHYETLRIELDPFAQEDPISILEERLKGLHPSAKVVLTVRGLFNSARLGINETELAEGIKEIAKSRCTAEPTFEFHDVQHVMEDDLFKQFNSRLDVEEYPPELKEQIKEMVISAFRVVKACS